MPLQKHVRAPEFLSLREAVTVAISCRYLAIGTGNCLVYKKESDRNIDKAGTIADDNYDAGYNVHELLPHLEVTRVYVTAPLEVPESKSALRCFELTLVCQSC
jgi:hypothetical protein